MDLTFINKYDIIYSSNRKAVNKTKRNMENKIWHVCGNYYSSDKKQKIAIDYVTGACETIYDAIKQAEEYGVKDISKVFISKTIKTEKGE